jgi:hypothetical protein
MIRAPSTITTELIRHTDGGPVAYIDAAVAVFAYQQANGSHVIEITTRERIPAGQLRLLLDGDPLVAIHGQRAAA